MSLLTLEPFKKFLQPAPYVESESQRLFMPCFMNPSENLGERLSIASLPPTPVMELPHRERQEAPKKKYALADSADDSFEEAQKKKDALADSADDSFKEQITKSPFERKLIFRHKKAAAGRRTLDAAAGSRTRDASEEAEQSLGSLSTSHSLTTACGSGADDSRQELSSRESSIANREHTVTELGKVTEMLSEKFAEQERIRVKNEQAGREIEKAEARVAEKVKQLEAREASLSARERELEARNEDATSSASLSSGAAHIPVRFSIAPMAKRKAKSVEDTMTNSSSGSSSGRKRVLDFADELDSISRRMRARFNDQSL